jgi:uncharacterized protein YgiM (DUF1202 family)
MATATVTATSLWVRKGPGTSYAKLGTLSHNQTVTVNGQSNGWYQISFKGQTGFISGKYAKYSSGGNAGGGSGSGSATASSSGNSYTITATALNVRKGAGTSYGILGTLSQNATVTALAESSGWLKIMFKGQEGWISKKYTKASSGGGSSDNTVASAPAAVTTGKSGSVTCDCLNVRSGAGTTNNIIGKLYRGEGFTYTAESNGWLKISYKGGTGWISKAYTSVGGGNAGGGGGGGNVVGKQGIGSAIANTARSLMSKYVSEGWTYSQDYRLSTGHYDCSSFAYRCCSAAGVSGLNTNSVGQAKVLYNAGAEVSLSNIQEGDLIFFHNNWNSGERWRGINHVAVAVGGGRRVDAGGTPVKEKDLSGNIKMIGRPAALVK